MSETGFETIASEEWYAGRSTVRVDTVRTPDGRDVSREIVTHDDAVAIVPVTTDGRVVLLRQYRHAVGTHVLEIPAGTLDVEGEGPVAAAERELAEETGYRSASYEHLVTFANSAGWTDEQTHVYLARDVSDGGVPDGFEAEAEEADMTLVYLDFDDAVGAARRGEIMDAKTLVGLLLANQRR